MFRIGQKTKIGILVVAGLIVVAVIAIYLCKDSLLNHYAKGKFDKLEKEYGLRITYDRLHMPGINEVEIEHLTVVPHERDTLLTLRSSKVKLSLWEMLWLNAEMKRVTTDGLHLSFVKKDSLSNYDFLFKKEQRKDDQEDRKDYASKVSHLLKLLFGSLPDNGDMKDFVLSHRKDTVYTEVQVPMLHIEENRFETEINVKEGSVVRQWISRGRVHSGEKTVEAELYSKNPGKVLLPYLNKYYGAQVAFDTLSYRLTETKRGGEVTLNGKAEVCGLQLYHPGLSPEVVDLDRGRFNYTINVGKDFVELDSATTVQFNRLDFHPYIRAQKSEKWHITMAVDKPAFPADDLFSSLPKGLFSNLEGLKTSGNLSYHFLLDVDFNNLNALKLESDLKGNSFKITGYGKESLSKMNGSFLYTAYENGRPVRTFIVGPENPNFRPLDSISPLLQTAVMQSEDGSFYSHRGFRLDALRLALIHDLKVKKFARGGSTISMQLVKNVFLNRNKNLLRKLEEAMIVWLVENQGLTSKHRMYEVYLNIAEWGPMVYGACEASHFYFGKEPSQLTPEEAIFMASLIPKPKRYRSYFDENMQLRSWLGGYFRLIANRLSRKGLITEEQAAAIQPIVVLSGSAVQGFSAPKDSVTVVELPVVEETDK
ncbi:biosynthetic peptidoglycan transglycosylase [Bacteroides sedimenti]|uniref:Penicillin-binding protein n=1 Tax=Bacteroides sedimenti TaxID=2136147 RepID=A0ABN6ZCS2_9BACE